MMCKANRKMEMRIGMSTSLPCRKPVDITQTL